MIISVTIVSVILMAIFLAATVAGGRLHDEQNRLRDRAEEAQAEKIRKEALSDPKGRP
jgi:hypothetical protein